MDSTELRLLKVCTYILLVVVIIHFTVTISPKIRKTKEEPTVEEIRTDAWRLRQVVVRETVSYAETPGSPPHTNGRCKVAFELTADGLYRMVNVFDCVDEVGNNAVLYVTAESAPPPQTR